MRNFSALAGLILIFLISACKTTKKPVSTGPAAPIVEVPEVQPSRDTAGLLENLMKKYPAQFSHILQFRDSLSVQVIYTQIDRNSRNEPLFTHHTFNLDSGRYFYPASTVKMPVALLALQRLRELGVNGLGPNSTFITEAAGEKLYPVYNDPTTPDGRPTLDQYIKKIFLVSDNEAFNRLYEFVGPEYINREMIAKGFHSTQIRHRLSIALKEEENRTTNPVKFLSQQGSVLYEQPMNYDATKYELRNDKVGIGFLRDDKVLLEGPVDFSLKNRISLPDLHSVLMSIMFPYSVKPSQRFRIAEEDYRRVWKYMSEYPTESKYPSYAPEIGFATSSKYFFYGADSSRKPVPGIRIFNKIGGAYGFLLDVAYVVDFEKKIEFMLSAVIYCNRDGILNDDKYDYESIGYPFLRDLGRVIYDYEQQRTRKNLPDLREFVLDYKE